MRVRSGRRGMQVVYLVQTLLGAVLHTSEEVLPCMDYFHRIRFEACSRV